MAGCFLFLFVSTALDVEGMGDGVCKMSEDPSETSFSLQSASVVTVADTAGAAEGIFGEKIETDFVSNYLGHV